MGNGGVLFDYRHLLQWRALPNAPPALGFFPPPDQPTGNFAPSIVRSRRAGALKDPVPVVHREIVRLRLLECRLPFTFELNLLVRGGELTHPPQNTAL